jgi:hypothetical protein
MANTPLCSRCKEAGHRHADCPRKREPLACLLCQQPGHLAHQCRSSDGKLVNTEIFHVGLPAVPLSFLHSLAFASSSATTSQRSPSSIQITQHEAHPQSQSLSLTAGSSFHSASPPQTSPAQLQVHPSRLQPKSYSSALINSSPDRQFIALLEQAEMGRQRSENLLESFIRQQEADKKEHQIFQQQMLQFMQTMMERLIPRTEPTTIIPPTTSLAPTSAPIDVSDAPTAPTSIAGAAPLSLPLSTRVTRTNSAAANTTATPTVTTATSSSKLPASKGKNAK